MKTSLNSLLVIFCLTSSTVASELDVWLGTVTGGNSQSKGIYHSTLDAQQGKLATPRLVAEIQSPGFLALHPDLDVLYSTGTIDGEPSLVAFEIERDNGNAGLKLLNSQPTGASGAAHLATDRTGKVLLSAHYGHGSIVAFPLKDDGSIAPASSHISHAGASRANPQRQEAPHPHWIGTSPDNRFAFVPDLGLDKVMIYALDAENATLKPHGEGKLPPGSGPRHMKFHPNGRFIYVLNELTLTISVFAYDAGQGMMTLLQTIPTISEETKAAERTNSASEIRVHPSGQFVYAANRGHDTISVFRVDRSSGKLAAVEVEPVRGSWPRNFNLDPGGRWLLVAGRDSNTLAMFEIDEKTGELTYAREMISVPSPICVTIGAK